MVDPKMKWGERIPALRDYASQLLSLANDVVSARTGPHKVYDFLGTMIDAFTRIQMDHLRSICILIDAGQSQDAEIIGRSSVESMYLLLWSAYGPKDNPGKTRPFYWCAYLYIEEYRQMIKTDVNGVDLETETLIFQRVKEFGHLFLTKDNQKNLRQFGAKELPDDPFITRWPSENRRMIVDELKDLGQIYPTLPHYEGIYRGLSQWSHSTQRSIGRVYCCDKDVLSHNTEYCNFMGARAIEVGFEALSRSLVLFNNHFKLSFGDKINDLETRYFELWPESELSLFHLEQQHSDH
jgi:hypothetical protein